VSQQPTKVRRTGEWLAAALRAHGRFTWRIGVLIIFRHEVRRFADKQIELMETFADQAVIAIENVRLFNELQARNRDLTDALERQTATAEILRVISGSPTEVQPVFDIIGERAEKLCDEKSRQLETASRHKSDFLATYPPR
jgi:GAF domain-containing protein